MILKDYKPIFLSTQIIPAERIKRINEIKAKKTKIVVSTQLVEAGVDIDFEVVYRDFAPLDSIIQSAGRCNRGGLFDTGDVFVLKLTNENNRLYASYIYDSVLLEATMKILNKDVFFEQEISNLINEYYKEISKIKSKKDSYDLLEHLYSLKFYAEKEKNMINSIADFVLIEDDIYKSSVFIEIDENASKLWQEYVKIKEIKDIFKRRKEFYKIKGDFYNYVVNVQVKENTPPYKEGFYHVSGEMLPSFYDMETGFIDKKENQYEFI
jgi:CRISPR-associated endonuclease/helicase Cas3